MAVDVILTRWLRGTSVPGWAAAWRRSGGEGGAVPGLGDLLDIGYQADRRSAALIKEWIGSRS